MTDNTKAIIIYSISGVVGLVVFGLCKFIVQNLLGSNPGIRILASAIGGGLGAGVAYYCISLLSKKYGISGPKS